MKHNSVLEHTELEALALITIEGLQLAFSCIPGYDINPDLFSSLSAVVMKSASDAIDSMGFKKMLEVVLKGQNGFIILSAAGKFFLLGASRNIGDLGKIVTVFRYYAGETVSYTHLTLPTTPYV